MSQTKNIVCLTCNESLWIGQNTGFYSAQPKTMDALRIFLLKHETDYLPSQDQEGYFDLPDHCLAYIHEPFNENIKEWDEDELIRWESEHKFGVLNDQ